MFIVEEDSDIDNVDIPSNIPNCDNNTNSSVLQEEIVSLLL